ncbi:MAG TPA: hypothetical protein VMW67_08145 [Desulfobacteria bacterium]|nr:hypothetical protein [Desulfobacteria bacterium]
MTVSQNYCPVVGECPHEPVDTISNSYFLVQPFDSEKANRENAIKAALTEFYGDIQKYKLKKSDSKAYDFGSFCDICLKIKSSEFCIVDISGELYETIDKVSGKKETKPFLRPNVALELGMAYGFNKPALILSRKLNNKRLIPSDIEFIRYIDISPIEFRGWSVASQKLLNRLRDRQPFIPIKKSLDLDIGIIKKELRMLLRFKERWPSLKRKSFKINQILLRGGKLIGIIENAKDLMEDMWFKIYVSENGLEDLVGRSKVYHVQPDGLAQVEIFKVEEGVGEYLEKVYRHCRTEKYFTPERHRLELIEPSEIEKLTLEEVRNIKEHLDKL